MTTDTRDNYTPGWKYNFWELRVGGQAATVPPLCTAAPVWVGCSAARLAFALPAARPRPRRVLPLRPAAVP